MGNFPECGDSIGDYVYITRIKPDTILNGDKRRFTIYGGNFDSDALIFLRKNTNSIVGDVKLATPYLIIVEFDLTPNTLFGEWEMIVKNPNGDSATHSIFIDHTILWSDFDWNGVRGFPVVALGNERANYFTVYNLGNSEGLLLFNIVPPNLDYIRLIIGNKNEPIWSSLTEELRDSIFLLVKLAYREMKTIPLWWGVSPEDVIFPPQSFPKLSDYDIILDDQKGKKPVFGENRPVTIKGLGGATKEQVKGMVTNILINSLCNNLGDKIREHFGQGEGRSILDNAVDAAISELKDAQDPRKILETVVKYLAQVPGWLDIAKSIADCVFQLVGNFIESWHSYVKQQADQIRGDPVAIERVNRYREQNWAGRITARQILIEALTEESPCNPPPSYSQTWGAQVRGPFDPNDKRSSSGFIILRPESDTTYEIHLIPTTKLSEPIQYVILFENKAQATDSATTVTITDTLDSDLDISTLVVDSALSTHQRGTIQWSLADNILTVQYNDIMLPPNVNPPEGEWQFVYSIKPKPGLPLGTEIRNRASIVFDYNPPIITPEVIHIIGAPEITSTKEKVDFGVVTIGSSVADTIYVMNIGGYNLAVGEIAGLEPPFSLASNSCSGKKLGPGDSCSIVIQFSPTSETQYIDTLLIASSDLSKYPFRVVCLGGYTSSVEFQQLQFTFKLEQNIPNPFNSTTCITYGVPKQSHVVLEVYDAFGRKIQTLINQRQEAGIYTVEFDASGLPSGVYFYRVVADLHSLTRGMVYWK